MTKEKEIRKYMEKLGISYEEAEQLWEDDQEDYIGEEGEAMTKKAKEIKNYTQSDKTKRKKSTRERKVDHVKRYLLELAETGLDGFVENVEYQNEVSISFDYEGEHYSLKLTRHRPPKKKKKKI